MTKFGWCLDGHHGDCRGAVIGETGDVLCACDCHERED